MICTLWYFRRTSDRYCARNCGSTRFLERDTARRLREETKSGDVTIASFVEHDRSKIFDLKLIWRNRIQVHWRLSPFFNCSAPLTGDNLWVASSSSLRSLPVNGPSADSLR
jgi:hypothetical protein